MQKITPFLWFDGNALEAARFYESVFDDFRHKRTLRYGPEGPGEEGSVMTVEFSLMGVDFAALNGGPAFKFNESVSFVVNCTTQQEIDYYWERLSDGGQKSQCGWVKDRFGLSWQITPVQLLAMMDTPDRAKASRVMNAMMTMDKLIIADLEAAADQ